MRLFGILLIIANLLAGAGFVYLSTQDWKGRQAINAAGLRHILLIKGLPLDGADFAADDETPFVVEMGGGESTKTVSKKLLESYFRDNTSASAGADAVASKLPLAANTPVTNQIAEVKRVQGLIKGELAKDAAPADKIALLKGWLLFQAENYDTRLDYLALTDVGTKTPDQLKADAAKLEEILDARFAAAIAAPQSTESPATATDAPMSDKDRIAKSAAWRAGAPIDDGQRRANLAHLLVHLDPDPAWQKRIIAVVGLRRYVKAVSLQVLRFAGMTQHVEAAIPEDQAAFVQQETILREKATQNVERAQAIAEKKAKKTEQKTASDDSVNRRRTQLKTLTDQLTKVKNEVDELLVRQTGIEKQLFEVQREVGLTLEDVYRLETLLDAIERERFGLPPRVNPER